MREATAECEPARRLGRLREVYDAVRGSGTTYRILLAGIALVAALVVLHGLNKELLGDANFLALDKDNNLPSWATTALFVVAGLASGGLAWLAPHGRIPLALLATLALLLSLEQMAQIHTRVEEDLGDGATVVLEPVMALGLIGVVALAGRGLPGLSKALLWMAIASIALAQGSSLANSEFDLPYAAAVLFQVVEEVAELLTAVLLIAAAIQPALDAVVAYVVGQREKEGERESVAV